MRSRTFSLLNIEPICSLIVRSVIFKDSAACLLVAPVTTISTTWRSLLVSKSSSHVLAYLNGVFDKAPTKLESNCPGNHIPPEQIVSSTCSIITLVASASTYPLAPASSALLS